MERKQIIEALNDNLRAEHAAAPPTRDAASALLEHIQGADDHEHTNAHVGHRIDVGKERHPELPAGHLLSHRRHLPEPPLEAMDPDFVVEQRVFDEPSRRAQSPTLSRQDLLEGLPAQSPDRPQVLGKALEARTPTQRIPGVRGALQVPRTSGPRIPAPPRGWS